MNIKRKKERELIKPTREKKKERKKLMRKNRTNK